MPSDLERILKLEVPIIVLLGERRMPMGEVVSIVPGTIIELPKQADEELELLVNNKVVGTGTAVKVGENFGLKIAFIGNVKERIAALGAQGGAAGGSSAEDDAAAALAEQLLAGQV
ncbi:MAG: FliM/FliN family flagellar motor switch protein [Phycisphaerales bacterium]|nr:FliM/FliN family flagellar motor switch protein [Phycisphaerales bacterium]